MSKQGHKFFSESRHEGKVTKFSGESKVKCPGWRTGMPRHRDADSLAKILFFWLNLVKARARRGVAGKSEMLLDRLQSRFILDLTMDVI